ncbi:Heat shock protein 70 [Mycobacterium basiliense]|uniref:Heat shock protein 70 n=1 Tax=Mycobacterium basiliense TaxID=2094119 RepID=A0A447G910_9MYCO|nr:Hsp70 family protein [Mycobacterium basiliense]VDM86987.1 Heat shock protein 70 [Mycobacterium basiliense]
MSEALGMSIGVANLVAARVGGIPVRRASVLQFSASGAAEVGLPEENPNLSTSGLVLRGFVERVGDRAPLVAADGSKYRGETLTVDALNAMARTVGYGAPVTVAAPAYWSQNQFGALREALLTQPALIPNGFPPAVISDATAALSTLPATPGFPTSGIVAVCDFGAGGTSVTLANAGASFQQIGPTIRYREFSGDEIDQLILSHLLAITPGVDSADTSGTATRMGSVTRLLRGCQLAKEQLSTTTVTSIPTGPAGPETRLSRNEFERIITEPLDRFIGSVEELLQRSGTKQNDLVAVATVGGGAGIPLVTTRLSDRLQAPVFSTPQPMFSAAIGSALHGQEQSSAGAPTGAGPAVDAPTNLVGTSGASTEVSPTAWANQAAAAAASESASDNARSATYRALAWSQDTDTDNEPVPYTGPDTTGEYGSAAATTDYAAGYDPGYDQPNQERYAEAEPLPWYKRAAVVFSLAAAGLAILVAVVLGLTLGPSGNKPVNTTEVPAPEPITTTVIGPNNSPTVTVITPPPPATTATTPTPSTTATTTAPTTTTTTTSPATTTTTTTSPPPTTTTTQPTTTTRPTTTSQVTTTPPPTTTQPPTTTAAPITPTAVAPDGSTG